MNFEPGQKIGDYEVVARLGSGGLGVVYEVQHLISHRREAIKILLPDRSGTPEMVERFLREVQILATLSHTNIAALHNAFYIGPQLAMVMELVRGETLADRRVRRGISLPEGMAFASQILEALVYAHRLGVVHRDIKPSNIMITEGGLVKLLDFGIAHQEQASQLTQTGYLLGSLSYMSPEQVSGDKATSRSDLYSVGITLYELMTGILPITGKTNYEVLMGHMHHQPVPPHRVAPHVPVNVSDSIMRALAKDPAQRFQSAGEFLHALQPAPASGQTTFAVTPARPTPVPQPPPAPVTPTLSATGGSMPPKPSSVSGAQTLPMEEVTRKLAVYIGPVAKFVIRKLAAQSDDLDFIYREAAKQISSDSDRAAFLKLKRQ